MRIIIASTALLCATVALLCATFGATLLVLIPLFVAVPVVYSWLRLVRTAEERIADKQITINLKPTTPPTTKVVQS